MTIPFPSELRTLAFVPRWSIVATIHRDYVSSHSYYVALYSYLVSKVIKWDGPKEYLMLAALTHDLEETITSDIVGPVKKAIIDEEKAGDFLEAVMNQRFSYIVDDLIEHENGLKVGHYEEAHLIIKAADRMDALFYLLWERRMGNQIVDDLIPKAQAMLENAWRALPIDEKTVSRLWQTEVLPCIADHRLNGGRGI